MKLLYLTSPSFFDLEISLIRELSKRNEVKVLMIIMPTSQHSSAFSIDDLPQGVRIENFKNIPELKKYDNLIDRNIWFLASRENNSFYMNLRLSFLIKKFISDFRPDLIHLTSVAKNALTLLPILRQYNKILTVHDPIPHSKLSFFKNISRNIILKFFKNIIFLSHSCDEEFTQNYGYLGCKIFYSRLGIYEFLNSYSENCIHIDNYILFFGRIDQYKGVDILVEAFRQSNLSKKGVKLVIAGSGKEQKFNSITNTDNIILMNRYIHNHELASLIRNALFTVLPYRTATQSGCLFSSFAFDKPVVATTVGDLAIEVKDGKTGILVKPSNITSLAEGLCRMYSADLQNMRTNIHQLYAEEGEYSWSRIANGLIDIYKQIIK